MTVKELRDLFDEWHAIDPKIYEAEVQVNLGHAIEGIGSVHQFPQKKLVVLFPVSVPNRVRMPSREEFERIKKRQEGKQ